jgi:hypothetical protein
MFALKVFFIFRGRRMGGALQLGGLAVLRRCGWAASLRGGSLIQNGYSKYKKTNYKNININSLCKTMRKQKQTIKVQNIYRNIKNTNTTIKMKIVKIQKNKNVK